MVVHVTMLNICFGENVKICVALNLFQTQLGCHIGLTRLIKAY